MARQGTAIQIEQAKYHVGLLDLPDQVLVSILRELDPLSLCWTSRANRHLFCLAGAVRASPCSIDQKACLQSLSALLMQSAACTQEQAP